MGSYEQASLNILCEISKKLDQIRMALGGKERATDNTLVGKHDVWDYALHDTMLHLKGRIL